ncbi:DNA oxidative demethylase AlkB [Pseudomonas sp. NPDC090202]|uniref:DNA oxidative demethylase AlkB n=1 Tax=unclassified Pseudomonas TaxID=196821 RepID=UPI003802A668
MRDLFDEVESNAAVALGTSAFVLPGFAMPDEKMLLDGIASLESRSPFQKMKTPSGLAMSVSLINCGKFGWTSSRFGYKYSEVNPETGKPWPEIPAGFAHLASQIALTAGFKRFEPNTCVINRYLPGAKLSLHQDKHERNLEEPVVTISLGMTATFLFGGHERSDKTLRTLLHHGDAVVWGGEDRLRYHGILPVADYPHPILGSRRISITFRKVD